MNRPLNTQNKNGRFVNRPYKQISAENLFSLPICVIMECAVGWGFALCVCNTKAKLAIIQNSHKDLENWVVHEEIYMDRYIKRIIKITVYYTIVCFAFSNHFTYWMFAS